MEKVCVALPAAVVRRLRKLGEGNLSAGIRVLCIRYDQMSGRSMPASASLPQSDEWDERPGWDGEE